MIKHFNYPYFLSQEIFDRQPKLDFPSLPYTAENQQFIKKDQI